MDSKELNINIFGRDLKLKCNIDEAESLVSATKILNEKLIDISNKTNIKNLEMLAIMAALNLIHESNTSLDQESTLSSEYKNKIDSNHFCGEFTKLSHQNHRIVT